MKLLFTFPLLLLLLIGCDNREKYAEDIRERGGTVREGTIAPPVVNLRITDNNIQIPGKVPQGEVVFNVSNRAKDSYRFFIEGGEGVSATELNIRSGHEGRMESVFLTPGKYRAVAIGSSNNELSYEFEIEE